MSAPENQPDRWRCTTEHHAWVAHTVPSSREPYTGPGSGHVMVLEDQPAQTMTGFGGTVNELGWQALLQLPDVLRDELLQSVFVPGKGLGLNHCRIPIGASDYAAGWYSHNEVAGDLEMANFDVARDDQALVPYIQAIQSQRSDVTYWASPWCPPTWMKRNAHYAMAPSAAGRPDNGLEPAQALPPGQDAFAIDDAHLEAYALYFSKFVEAYRERGIPISLVMPQNEFNSAQVFPSCCWTAEGLIRFLTHLGPRMQALDVRVGLGTLEKPTPGLIEQVLGAPNLKPFVSAIGLQWAARKATPIIQYLKPELELWQTEQECGDGRNDWRFARYAWKMMREYISGGVSMYSYWNIVTPEGGVSTWGWPQNAMFSVDMARGTYRFNPDFHVFRHLSAWVLPGARRLETVSVRGTDNLLAFRNPDGSIVVVLQNDLPHEDVVRLVLRNSIVELRLPADSINTLSFGVN